MRRAASAASLPRAVASDTRPTPQRGAWGRGDVAVEVGGAPAPVAGARHHATLAAQEGRSDAGAHSPAASEDSVGGGGARRSPPASPRGSGGTDEADAPWVIGRGAGGASPVVAASAAGLGEGSSAPWLTDEDVVLLRLMAV